jgi:ubiquinone biosynthesis protein
MEDQIGFRALQRRFFAEAASLVETLPELPRLLHERLSDPPAASDVALRAMALAQQSRNRWLAAIALLLVVVVALLVMQR